MSEAHLAPRYTCTWPWSTLVLLCDGRVVCGCADPYGRRVLGDARRQSVAEIWRGETASALRQGLNAGGTPFCGDCPLKLPLREGEPAPQRPLEVGPLPTRLYVECTAACNLSCYQACCAPETGITRTREAGMLDFDLFARVLDETGASLVRLDFFNYGETFLHKRAVEMCERVKTLFPQVYLYTSTNGLALDEERARRLARSGIDEVTFSIDGATQATYERYRRRGRLDVALRNLHALVDEKRRAGRDVPAINWRYILFRWNDSDEEMNRARQLAAELGADRLTWEVTDHPEDAYRGASCPARRTSPPSAARCGTTTTSATRSPGRCRARASTSARGCPACRSSRGPAGEPPSAPACTTCRAAPSPPPRATAAASSALAPSCAIGEDGCRTATSRARGCRPTCRAVRRLTCPSSSNRSRPAGTVSASTSSARE